MRRPKQKVKSGVRGAVGLAALLWLAALAASCGGAGGPRELFEFVPPTSLVTASLDWRAARGDAALRRLLPGGSADGVFRPLALSDEEVDEFVVFGDGRDARSGSTGVILRGQFDPEEVAGRLAARGWREQTREGVTIYASPEGDQYCAPLGDLLVAGSRRGVKAVLEPGGEENQAANPTYEKLAARLAGSDAPFLIIVAAPQRVQDMADAGLAISSAALRLADLDVVGGLVKHLGVVRGVGCALTHEGGSFPVEVVAVMRDEEAAGLVSGTLNLAQEFAGVVPPDAGATASQRESFERFRQMSVERDEDVLSIKLVMTEAQLQTR